MTSEAPYGNICYCNSDANRVGQCLFALRCKSILIGIETVNQLFYPHLAIE